MHTNPHPRSGSQGLGRDLSTPAAFAHPGELLEDGALSNDEKRATLASWLSDCRTVEDRPWLRRLDSGYQVPARDIYEALKQLDRSNDYRLGNKRRGRRSEGHDPDDDPPPAPLGARLPPHLQPGGGAAHLVAELTEAA